MIKKSGRIELSLSLSIVSLVRSCHVILHARGERITAEQVEIRSTIAVFGFGLCSLWEFSLSTPYCYHVRSLRYKR